MHEALKIVWDVNLHWRVVVRLHVCVFRPTSASLTLSDITHTNITQLHTLTNNN